MRTWVCCTRAAVYVVTQQRLELAAATAESVSRAALAAQQVYRYHHSLAVAIAHPLTRQWLHLHPRHQCRSQVHAYAQTVNRRREGMLSV